MPRTKSSLALSALLRKPAPLIMGIVNVTPDSFYDGGSFYEAENAVHHALRLVEAGADLLDVGGESTRPGSRGVPAEEELRRVLPVIEGILKRIAIPISIDTSKAEVAEAALAAGASILNDVTALRGDPGLAAVAARAGCPVVLMHMKGSPADMQKTPRYSDVAREVMDFLSERLSAFEEAGGDRGQVLVDPGLGFGKTLSHNLDLLRALPRLAELAPVVVGASRKSFLGRLMAGQGAGPDLPLDQVPPPAERGQASVAAAIFAASRGAAVLRVHDVAETKAALSVWSALEGERA
jgi:dihydropteroate synthase